VGALQKPNASYVAGFRTWNQLGRFVKKGEKGIVILAPIVRRKAENDEDHEEASASVAGFRAAYVFDVSQTDGQELPHIGIVQGQPREYRERLRAFAEAQGISVEYSWTLMTFGPLDTSKNLIGCQWLDTDHSTSHTNTPVVT
jgi:antirestriction protein ArdC